LTPTAALTVLQFTMCSLASLSEPLHAAGSGPQSSTEIVVHVHAVDRVSEMHQPAELTIRLRT